MVGCEILKEMGERISLRRKALGMTQEQFAEKLGVSTQMISNLELGKKAIRPENLIKVCHVLGMSADYILCGVKSGDELTSIAEKLSTLAPGELKIVSELIDYMAEKR